MRSRPRLQQSMEIMGMKMVNVSTPKGGYMEQMGQKRPIPVEQIAERSFARLFSLLSNPEVYQIQFLKEDKLVDQPVNVLLARGALDKASGALYTVWCAPSR